MIGITEGDTVASVPTTAPPARSGAGPLLPRVNEPGVTDLDIAQLAEQVTTANANYRAALQTNATVRQQSLLSFLD